MQQIIEPGRAQEQLQAGAPTVTGQERPRPVVDGEEVSPCPNCGSPMNGIRGSKSAVCENCGFKDSCCF